MYTTYRTWKDAKFKVDFSFFLSYMWHRVIRISAMLSPLSCKDIWKSSLTSTCSRLLVSQDSSSTFKLSVILFPLKVPPLSLCLVCCCLLFSFTLWGLYEHIPSFFPYSFINSKVICQISGALRLRKKTNYDWYSWIMIEVIKEERKNYDLIKSKQQWGIEIHRRKKLRPTQE